VGKEESVHTLGREKLLTFMKHVGPQVVALKVHPFPSTITTRFPLMSSIQIGLGLFRARFRGYLVNVVWGPGCSYESAERTKCLQRACSRTIAEPVEPWDVIPRRREHHPLGAEFQHLPSGRRYETTDHQNIQIFKENFRSKFNSIFKFCAILNYDPY
jgi:hypothetical protein